MGEDDEQRGVGADQVTAADDAVDGAAGESADGTASPVAVGARGSGDLVRGAALVLARNWLPLLAIGAASLLGRELVSDLAVSAGLVGAVPGFLTLALVPLVSLAALVAMLLVVRRRGASSSHLLGVVAAAGSVLVPFLVVYESRGDLRADLIDYVRGTLYEQLGAEAVISSLPQIASWTVLGIVVAALVVRAVGARLVDTDHLGARDGRLRGVLHVVVGYAEAVWVTLGAWVLTGILAGLGVWWSGREIARSMSSGWARVRESLPSLGAFGDWVLGAVPVVTDAVITGVLVPLSMLTIAVIVYGLQVADTVRPDDVVAAVRRGPWTGLTSRVRDVHLRQAWRALSDTEGRFGALFAGIALVLRSAFTPVLVYCVLFTVVAQLDLVVWWLARTVLGWRDELVWEALYAPLGGVAELITLVVTVALTAAYADGLLTRFGAPSQVGRR